MVAGIAEILSISASIEITGLLVAGRADDDIFDRLCWIISSFVNDVDLELDGDVDAELLEEFGRELDCVNEGDDNESDEVPKVDEGDDADDKEDASKTGVDEEKVSITSGGGCNGSELFNSEFFIFLL